ncbi:MAG TPA: pantetheine-phosphate adenylyltransferase, partial [Burkholderiales bacterium]|nr:pantetheine-phosphate adenylyltransferase [Burkholderiales bacterium]
MRVCLGGTFERLHRGHEALLAKAFGIGTHVFIGVTSDGLAQKGRTRQVTPYAAREKSLRALLSQRGWANKATVAQIDEPYGRALEGDYDAIAISPETRPTAEALNRDRQAAGRHALTILEAPYAVAADGFPISATRIAQGRIDEQGRLLAPAFVVGSDNPVKVEAVRRVVERAFPKGRVALAKVASGVPEQPFEHEIVRGAANRARAALAWDGSAVLGVGIEAGIVFDPRAGQHHDVQYCVVADRAGGATIGHGP